MAHEFTLGELRTIFTAVSALYRTLSSLSTRFKGLDEAREHNYLLMVKVKNMILDREDEELIYETEE